MSESNNFDMDKTIQEIKKDRNLAMVVGGALALLIGMFLPWVTVDVSIINVSANGFDANGILPLILLVVAVGAALNVLKQDVKVMWITALAASALVALIVILDWPSGDDAIGAISVGIGYYISLVGSIVMTVGAGMKFMMLNDSKAKITKPAEKKTDDK